MSGKSMLAKTLFFPMFVVGCFVVGWMMPTFYDWSGADQSHSTPAADLACWSLVGFGVLSWLVIPWLPMSEPTIIAERKPFQFNLRRLLAITTMIAIVIVGMTRFSVAFCILLWVIAFVAVARMIAKELSGRWQLAALLSCMYFPYVWAFVPGEFSGGNWAVILGGAIGLPAFLPTFFLGGLLGVRSETIVWLWILMTAIEIAIGILLIRSGPRRTIAYFVLVMLMSIYGSMSLNALMRA